MRLNIVSLWHFQQYLALDLPFESENEERQQKYVMMVKDIALTKSFNADEGKKVILKIVLPLQQTYFVNFYTHYVNLGHCYQSAFWCPLCKMLIYKRLFL